MGLYSKMLNEQTIRQSFEGAKNILMVTCPGCACESLSYSENLPCRSLQQGKDMEHSALAVHMVRDKWDAILRDMGIEVFHLTIGFSCEMFDTDRQKIAHDLAGKDTIGVLCCSSGYVGLKDAYPDFPGKLIPMMRTAGTFVFRLVRDETGENSKVDRATARVISYGK